MARSTPKALSIVIAVFLVLSALWAWRVAIPTAPPDRWSHFNPDEWNHVAVIEFMAAHHTLPPYNAAYNTSIHPPLYHALAALVYSFANPLLGRACAVLFLRVLSAALGGGVIWFTYRAGRLITSRASALLAAGCVAGVPMFVSLSAAVTNESLAAFAAAAALYEMIVCLRYGPTFRRVLFLSLWIAVGIATKLSCLGLLPTAILAIWWARRRDDTGRSRLFWHTVFMLGCVLLSMGWWFVRNKVVYGDPFREAAIGRVWGETQPGYEQLARRYSMSAWAYGVLISEWGWRTFWGKFDAMRFFLAKPLYWILAGIQLATVVSFALGRRRWWIRGYRRATWVLMTVFAASVLAIFYRFNWQHFSPQGRYFFPLLVPFGLVTAIGWRAAFPRGIRTLMSAVLLTFLLLLNVHALVIMTSHPAPIP